MSRPLTAVVVALVTAANYGVWLAWDQHKDVGPDGVSGPYEVWQVAGLVAVSIVGAIVAGARRRAVLTAVVATVVMTLVFSWDGATDAERQGLWVIGAFLVAVGTFAGVVTVGLLTGDVVRARRRRRGGRGGR